MNTLQNIQNYSQIHPLKEIWIGDTYPQHFYSMFDSRTEDVFCQITENTQKELDGICNTLRKLGVNVVRPQFEPTIDKYLDRQGKLIKPPMAPADWAITIDDTLYINPQYYSGIEVFQHAIDSYKQAGQKVAVLDRSKDSMSWVNFPAVTRMGMDIYIDYDEQNAEAKAHTMTVAAELSKFHRVNVTNTGDHTDGVFCPVQPGALLSTIYKNQYDKSFPDWQVHYLIERPRVPSHNFKWWLPGAHYANYNSEILSVAESWLGNPWETIFSVNCILIDEKNILVIKEDESAFSFFKSIGMTPHVTPFNMCYFWDSGLHCLSSDVYRAGPMLDYWPNKGEKGVYILNEQ